MFAPLGAMTVVVVHPPRPIRRTWRERLFSRPWNPFRASTPGTSIRWQLVQQAGGCLRNGDTIYMSPEVYAELKKHTKAEAFPELARPT